MKKILLTILFILITFTLTFSQSKFLELEKIKKIKIFESNYRDVQKILVEYIEPEEGDYDGEVYFQRIPTKNGQIIVTFSKGNCADDEEYWNVSKGLVTSVAISHIDGVKVKDLSINLKYFKKEIEDKEFPNDIDYHDEKKGIFIETDEGDVNRIVFYPPKIKKAFLCINENTKNIISGKERLVDKSVPFIAIDKDYPPIINEVILSETEVFASNKDKKNKISIRVNATDPEGGVLVYNYTVSAGKIIGQGAKVTWDLTGVKPGTYKIIVTIDDGCGVCAKPMTKTVFVK